MNSRWIGSAVGLLLQRIVQCEAQSQLGICLSHCEYLTICSVTEHIHDALYHKNRAVNGKTIDAD